MMCYSGCLLALPQDASAKPCSETLTMDNRSLKDKHRDLAASLGGKIAISWNEKDVALITPDGSHRKRLSVESDKTEFKHVADDVYDSAWGPDGRLACIQKVEKKFRIVIEETNSSERTFVTGRSANPTGIIDRYMGVRIGIFYSAV